MQHQLQAHATFFCQKTSRFHHSSRRDRRYGFCRLCQRHHRNFAFHLTWLPRFNLTGSVTDLEFYYRYPGGCVAQTALFSDRAANDSLVTVQLVVGYVASVVSLASSAGAAADLGFSSRIMGEGAVMGPSILIVRWRSIASLNLNA